MDDHSAASTLGKRALHWTFVVYDSGDRLGKLLALTTLAPIFVIVALVAVSLACREVHVILMLVALLWNDGLNAAIKTVIRQPRPQTALIASEGTLEFGMPSAHSQFMAFFAVYLIILFRARKWTLLVSHETLILLAGTVLTAACTIASRAYLGYHTVEQVVVGTLVGIVHAIAVGWVLCLSPIGGSIRDWLVHAWPGRLFCLKDSSLTPYPLVQQRRSFEQHETSGSGRKP